MGTRNACSLPALPVAAEWPREGEEPCQGAEVLGGPRLFSASPADGGLSSEVALPTRRPLLFSKASPAEKSDGCGRGPQRACARSATLALSHLSGAGGGGRV